MRRRDFLLGAAAAPVAAAAVAVKAEPVDEELTVELMEMTFDLPETVDIEVYLNEKRLVAGVDYTYDGHGIDLLNYRTTIMRQDYLTILQRNPKPEILIPYEIKRHA